jgi:hypothetical protein
MAARRIIIFTLLGIVSLLGLSMLIFFIRSRVHARMHTNHKTLRKERAKDSERKEWEKGGGDSLYGRKDQYGSILVGDGMLMDGLLDAGGGKNVKQKKIFD